MICIWIAIGSGIRTDTGEKTSDPAKTGDQQVMAKDDTTWKPGQSGNPAGRPEGSRNKASLMAEN